MSTICSMALLALVGSGGVRHVSGSLPSHPLNGSRNDQKGRGSFPKCSSEKAPGKGRHVAVEPFKIRGMLPWHNFLQGPSSFNLADWVTYLNDMADMGMNLLVLHAYQGGTERYADYVEPHVRSEYQGVRPRAAYDTSLGPARWGYSPLAVDDFGYNTSALFGGERAFGAHCATRDPTRGVDGSQTQCAQELLREVFKYAHSLDIQVNLGFEFGVWPPEYHSIAPAGMMTNPYLSDPFTREGGLILQGYIRNLLTDYPALDYIGLWMHENPVQFSAGYTGTFTPYNATHFTMSPGFVAFNDTSFGNFTYLADPQLRFMGVWCLAYVLRAMDILRQQASLLGMPGGGPRPVLSGWGGPIQLTPLLQGLHAALPDHVVFAVLQPEAMCGLNCETPPSLVEISRAGREVWLVPWLEYDGQLWQPQPRVGVIAGQVQAAARDGIPGVLALHWRGRNDTDIAFNWEAYHQVSDMPSGLSVTVDSVYQDLGARMFGDAAPEAAKLLCDAEKNGTLRGVNGESSAEYFPYNPRRGCDGNATLAAQQLALREELRKLTAVLKNNMTAARRLQAWEATVDFAVLYSEVSCRLAVPDALRTKVMEHVPTLARAPPEQIPTCKVALQSLAESPTADMFTAYSRRTSSRNEHGVLSSINQRLYVFERDLQAWVGEYCSSVPSNLSLPLLP